MKEELKNFFKVKQELGRFCPVCFHELRLDFETRLFMCDSCKAMAVSVMSKDDYVAPKSDMQLRIYDEGVFLPKQVIWIKDTRPTSNIPFSSYRKGREYTNYGDHPEYWREFD